MLGVYDRVLDKAFVLLESAINRIGIEIMYLSITMVSREWLSTGLMNVKWTKVLIGTAVDRQARTILMLSKMSRTRDTESAVQIS